MSFASKHNKGGIQWGIDSKDFPYISCKDLAEMGHIDIANAIVLRGLFISRNKDAKHLKEYGPSVVAIIDGKLVNLPNHMLEEVEGILADPEDVEAIKAGHVGFYIRAYESHGKDCYGVQWIDVE